MRNVGTIRAVLAGAILAGAGPALPVCHGRPCPAVLDTPTAGQDRPCHTEEGSRPGDTVSKGRLGETASHVVTGGPPLPASCR